jgi:hypothetical protein
LIEGLRGERVLAEQHVIATPGDLADRVCAAGPHPERWMRFLLRWRLNDDVVELPILAPMRERRFRGEGFGDDVHRLLKARLGLFQRDAEAGEFVVPVAFADPEIKPAAGQKVKRRCLLSQ